MTYFNNADQVVIKCIFAGTNQSDYRCSYSENVSRYFSKIYPYIHINYYALYTLLYIVWLQAYVLEERGSCTRQLNTWHLIFYFYFVLRIVWVCKICISYKENRLFNKMQSVILNIIDLKRERMDNYSYMTKK